MKRAASRKSSDFKLFENEEAGDYFNVNGEVGPKLAGGTASGSFKGGSVGSGNSIVSRNIGGNLPNFQFPNSYRRRDSLEKGK